MVKSIFWRSQKNYTVGDIPSGEDGVVETDPSEFKERDEEEEPGVVMSIEDDDEV